MFKTNSVNFPLCQDEISGNIIVLKKQLDKLGINVNIETGNIYYSRDFIPLKLNFELIFVRHGETYGNCGQSLQTGEIDNDLVKNGIKNKEKRIYQGDVDARINQLTEHGKQQALYAAEKLNDDFIKNGWIPDVILISPLTRAKDTALPFILNNKFEDKCITYARIKEMSFGLWDNKRICDIHPDDRCHLFYRAQNALVKNNGLNNEGIPRESECFCDVILRAHSVLMDLNIKFSGKKIIMFSHSMFGAACCILLGMGQKIEDGEYLAFDGQRRDGTYYTIPNALPFPLTKINSCLDSEDVTTCKLNM